MDLKIFLPKLVALLQQRKFCRDIVLSLLLNSCRGLKFPVAMYFHATSSILSRHNLTLSRHSSIDVVCFMSQHGCLFPR